jgi:hypothetical protein
MPIRKKRGSPAPSDAILTGEVPEAVEPGLAALLEDPISAGGTPSGLPRLRPSAPFLLRHWPLNWEAAELEGEAVWLPEVSAHFLVKGAAGIRTPAPHEPETNAYSDAVVGIGAASVACIRSRRCLVRHGSQRGRSHKLDSLASPSPSSSTLRAGTPGALPSSLPALSRRPPKRPSAKSSTRTSAISGALSPAGRIALVESAA